MVKDVRAAIRARFPGVRCINDASARPEDAEIVAAIQALGQKLNATVEVSVVAWHREIVKMALGLSCQVLGDELSRSPSADLLRQFLRAHDTKARSTIPISGRVGIANATPVLTSSWHPGGDEHLLAIIELSDRTVFVANLFGSFESFVQIDAGKVHPQLPGTGVRGVAWIVEPIAKTTRGPLPLAQVWAAP